MAETQGLKLWTEFRKFEGKKNRHLGGCETYSISVRTA
jgi:hypothetical protein